MSLLLVLSLFSVSARAQSNLQTFTRALECVQTLDLQKNDPLQNIDAQSRDKTVSFFGTKDGNYLAFLNLDTTPTEFCLVSGNELKCLQPKMKEDLKAFRPVPWEFMTEKTRVNGRSQPIQDGQSPLLNRFLGNYSVDFENRLNFRLEKIQNPARRCNTLKWTQEKVAAQCAKLVPELDQLIVSLKTQHETKCAKAPTSPNTSNGIPERQRSFLDGR